MEIKQNLTTVNFNSNGMKQIRGCVIHSMWGTYLGSIQWFKNPDVKASAHYLISQDGQITQMVKDSDMAWHAGVYDSGKCPDWALPNPNFYCLGIEFEDRREKDWPYPAPQRNAGAWLVSNLMQKYNIPREHILLHKNLNPSRRSDPVGQFSFLWLFSQVVSENDTLEEYKTQLAREIKNKNDTWQELQEVKSELEGVKAENITHQNYIKSLAITLQSEPEPASILGKITTLISEEDRLRKAVADCDEAKQKLDECQFSKQEIQNINNQQANTILEFRNNNEALKKELEHCKTGAKLTPFFKIGGIYLCTEANGKT